MMLLDDRDLTSDLALKKKLTNAKRRVIPEYAAQNQTHQVAEE